MTTETNRVRRFTQNHILIMKNIFLTLATIFAFACETEITPKLNAPAEIIVVDAWVNQKMEPQKIRITRSQPYFDQSIPKKIPDAHVVIEDLNSGEIYEFQEEAESYFWYPTDQPFGKVGHEYKLTVTVDDQEFEAFSLMGRVPPIDSIIFHYNPKDMIVKKEYYTAEFVASDPAGAGDAYWIKAWKNGAFLGNPGELNMAYDAGFSAGQPVDGQEFIIPIRKDFMNPYDPHPEKANELLPPYEVGDSLYVEIHSLDHLAFDFLYGLYFQIARPGGFAELFSMPLANTSTNIYPVGDEDTPVTGFFNTSAVSSRGLKLSEELAKASMKDH